MEITVVCRILFGEIMMKVVLIAPIEHKVHLDEDKLSCSCNKTLASADNCFIKDHHRESSYLLACMFAESACKSEETISNYYA